MGFALVFSGQGMQHPHMMPWLDGDGPLREAFLRLGIDSWRTRLHDPQWAAGNRQVQLLLTACALSTWQRLAAELPKPRAVAGYSVGELAAFSAAGVMDAATAIALAEQRAHLMDVCAAEAPGGLIGVTGLDVGRHSAICSTTGVFMAIHNSPDSVVLGGTLADLPRAESMVQDMGGRCTRLKVSVASHTPLMRFAREGFAQALAVTPVTRPRTAVICNATADRVRSAEDARSALADQLDRTVLWQACMDSLHATQLRCVLEIGPGQSLAKMWNQLYPDVPARSVDEFRSVPAVTRWVHANMA